MTTEVIEFHDGRRPTVYVLMKEAIDGPRKHDRLVKIR